MDIADALLMVLAVCIIGIVVILIWYIKTGREQRDRKRRL